MCNVQTSSQTALDTILLRIQKPCKHTLFSKLWQQIFCGSDVYFQSMLVRWCSNAVAGMPITSRLMPSMPDSRRRTLTRRSTESRFARTHPAVPAPTGKQNINPFIMQGLWEIPLKPLFKLCSVYVYKADVSVFRTYLFILTTARGSSGLEDWFIGKYRGVRVKGHPALILLLSIW